MRKKIQQVTYMLKSFKVMDMIPHDPNISEEIIENLRAFDIHKIYFIFFKNMR